MNIEEFRLAFIGGGNMAASIIGGLVAEGYPAGQICVADPSNESLERLSKVAPIKIAESNADAVRGADVVVLAVKPQHLADAAAQFKQEVTPNQLYISIAAGITVASIESWLGDQSPVAVVRCMPNTPALVRQGATALYANSHVSDQQKGFASAAMGAVGAVQWVAQERQLDAITALSGSGPAYFFLLIEAMASAGVKLGLSPELSAGFAVETALGAARMAKESDVDPTELRRRVTSPGGTTAAALEVFASAEFSATVEDAMKAASDRAEEMAREMG